MPNLEISSDASRLDREAVYRFLAASYWAKERPREVIDRSLEGSMCFSAWSDGQMVAFARVVTDKATFAWLCDVFVTPEVRGQGVGKALMQAVFTHPELTDVRWMLATRDAHLLYEQFGFKTEGNTDRWMTKGFLPRVCD